MQKAAAGGTPTRAPIGYLNVRKRDELGRDIRTIEVEYSIPLMTAPDTGVEWTYVESSRTRNSSSWTVRCHRTRPGDPQVEVVVVDAVRKVVVSKTGSVPRPESLMPSSRPHDGVDAVLGSTHHQ